jgi:hypothetical protein
MTAATGQERRGGQGPIRLAAGRLVVEFTWSGDRWTHRAGPAGGPIWMSVEGPAPPAADPRWPASPVLVEVSLVEAAGGPAVVGVGLAGRSHFSLCITAHPAGGERLLCEAACRIHDPAGWLGSTYRGPDGGLEQVRPADPLPAPPATVSWRYTLDAGGPAAEPLPATASPAARG